MIKIERYSVMNLENAIRGARNPLNSWARSDSYYDENGNLLCQEDSGGSWLRYEYDEKGNIIKYEVSNGYYVTYKYDENNNIIYQEDSEGNWWTGSG